MLLLLHFLFGLTACFIGALPLGAINMSVLSISIRKSYRQAVLFLLGASIIEIAQAAIAIIFGLYINKFLNEHSSVTYLIATLFIALGIYFFVKKTPSKNINLNMSKNSNKSFFQGIGVASVNPQAIPFWLFTLAFITPFHLFQFNGFPLIYFLMGVFVGKISALIGFAKLSTYLEQSFTKNQHTIDYLMGTVFFSIGLIQIFTHLQ